MDKKSVRAFEYELCNLLEILIASSYSIQILVVSSCIASLKTIIFGITYSIGKSFFSLEKRFHSEHDNTFNENKQYHRQP